MSGTTRRSANYLPSIWDDEYLQSLSSIYGEERYLQQAEKLKVEVINLLGETNGPIIYQIELVDTLQRLGISYHFTEYLVKILQIIHNNLVANGPEWIADDLHAAALGFRLLRQHGYEISPGIFSNFMNDRGNFRTTLCNDAKGLLSLYEASFLSTEGESIMDEAQAFAAHHLRRKLKENLIDQDLAEEITHALEVPLHWRMLRLESRRFIDVYERRHDMNPLLLELAKLDFNIVQKMYQDELKQLSSWYTGTQLAEKCSFARNRLVECFLWTVGLTFEPYFSYCRIISVKLGVIVTIIDDIYDVYGTLDELELFTDAIKRWDINGLEQLPDYMKLCFLALFNTVNEMIYDVLRDQGFNITPYVTERWAELCEKYLIEARWYNSGYKPSLNEFLSNGWVSITGPVFIVTAYLCMTNPLNHKSLKDLYTYPEIFKWTSLICRLANDLGTSPDELMRGDNPKSIQCYMHEAGCSQEDARNYIKNLIHSTWKSINKDVLMNREHSRDFRTASINFARISQCIYQYGDGHGIPGESKKRILSMVIEPIPLP